MEIVGFSVHALAGRVVGIGVVNIGAAIIISLVWG
jgi:hypothetical protein